FSTSNLINHIKELSSDKYEGRRTETAGAIKAKDYIISQFQALNVLPINNTFEQSFTFETSKKYNATNVLGLIKGTSNTNKYIVLSAHYDHEGIKNGQIYNGADDDASGVSALFAFAEFFAKNPPKHHVILAAFDAEELGLKGAYHFVQDNTIQQKNIVLNLNMDMISRSDKNELFAVGTHYYPQLKPTIENFKDLGKVDLLIGHEGLDKADDWTNSSDHAAFHKADIPFIYFGVADHEDYHKPTDDFENIDQQFYKDAVQTIITVFVQLDSIDL
ncbi:MAG: M28 family peptidase, partial [Olleya sp.]